MNLLHSQVWKRWSYLLLFQGSMGDCRGKWWRNQVEGMWGTHTGNYSFHSTALTDLTHFLNCTYGIIKWLNYVFDVWSQNVCIEVCHFECPPGADFRLKLSKCFLSPLSLSVYLNPFTHICPSSNSLPHLPPCFLLSILLSSHSSAEPWEGNAAALCSAVRTLRCGFSAASWADWPHHEKQPAGNTSGPGGAVWTAAGQWGGPGLVDLHK